MGVEIGYAPARGCGSLVKAMVLSSNCIAASMVPLSIAWREAAHQLGYAMNINSETAVATWLVNYSESPLYYLAGLSVAGTGLACFGMRSTNLWRQWSVMGMASNLAALAALLTVHFTFRK